MTNKDQNKEQISSVIDALSKSIYERLFSWLIEKINSELDFGIKKRRFIGLLDISGFAAFEVYKVFWFQSKIL